MRQAARRSLTGLRRLPGRIERRRGRHPILAAGKVVVGLRRGRRDVHTAAPAAAEGDLGVAEKLA